MEAQAVDTSVVRVPLFRIGQSQSSPQPAILRPVPAATVGTSLLVGASPFFFEPSRRQNILVRERVQLYRRNTFDHRYFSFDNYTQFLPIGSVIALNLFGVKSVHPMPQLVVRSASTMLASAVLVHPIKFAVTEWRPNRSSSTSFPSGHTAFAFAGAELLRLEYSETSTLIPVAGYLVASLTGFMRVFNDCHWTGDVLAGAAIGIIAADLSWLLNNALESKIRNSRHRR